MSGYKDGFRRGTNYLHRGKVEQAAIARLQNPHAEVLQATSQRARCERGEHAEAVAEWGQVTYLAFGKRVEAGTSYCRCCSAVLPVNHEAAAAALPSRVAHVLHALMARWSDAGEAVTAAQVCEYDSEAVTVQHTAAALSYARRYGLASTAAPGRWYATRKAERMRVALEARFRAEVDGE